MYTIPFATAPSSIPWYIPESHYPRATGCNLYYPRTYTPVVAPGTRLPGPTDLLLSYTRRPWSTVKAAYNGLVPRTIFPTNDSCAKVSKAAPRLQNHTRECRRQRGLRRIARGCRVSHLRVAGWGLQGKPFVQGRNCRVSHLFIKPFVQGKRCRVSAVRPPAATTDLQGKTQWT